MPTYATGLILETVPSTEAADYASNAYRKVFGEEPTKCEVAILCAISWLETQYGEGWKGGSGEGSYNMGAVTADRSWTGETFEHEDSRWDAKKQEIVHYTTKFRKYPSAEAGWEDFVKAAFKWQGRDVKVRGPAKACNFLGVSQGLYDTVYYTGTASTPEANVQNHLDRLLNAIKAGGLLPGIINVSPPITKPPSPAPTVAEKSKTSIAPMLIMGTAGLVFLLTIRKPKRAR